MKKSVLFILVIFLCVSVFSSCSSLGNANPYDLALKLEEKNYDVYIGVDGNDLYSLVSGLGIDEDNIHCLLFVKSSTKDSTAVIIFCYETSTAEDVEEAFSNLKNNNEIEIVKRDGKVVFVGPESILDEIQ